MGQAQVPLRQSWPAAQAWPHAPQSCGSLLVSTHAAPHEVSPAAQAHMPPVHVSVPPQAWPQPPQFCGSVDVFTQLCPHRVKPAVHMPTQVPISQSGIVAPQTCPHMPQLDGSLASDRQIPLQSVVPSGQAQAPPAHVSPEAQAWPHAPQFCGSVAVATHACPHGVVPGAVHEQAPP
jgi:hypothetical protein